MHMRAHAHTHTHTHTHTYTHTLGIPYFEYISMVTCTGNTGDYIPEPITILSDIQNK